MKFFNIGFLALSFLAASAFGSDVSQPNIPSCLGGKGNAQAMDVNNAQLLTLKNDASVPSGFPTRGYIKGKVYAPPTNQNVHMHVEIDVSPTLNSVDVADHIELIYNSAFGAVGAINVGSEVYACGDFIKSTEPNGPYPASPEGAIIHWVHKAPNPQRHPSGYVVIDGRLIGQEAPRGPRDSNSMFPWGFDPFSTTAISF